MFDFIILTLATYGISMLLTATDGLGHVFMRLRNKYPNSALQCVYCTSVWVVVPLFIVYQLGSSSWLVPFGVIGAIFIIKDLE